MPINKIPPETLALIATFFGQGRPLINATGVCQYWRATLLSSPLLWSRIIHPNRIIFETCLERSESVPLKVELRNTSLDLLGFLGPHVSRLSSLTLMMHDSSGFEQLARHLGNPIPTLIEFSLYAGARGDKLTIPSDIRHHHFLHVKKLRGGAYRNTMRMTTTDGSPRSMRP